jgi:predicted DNA-binding transcriptional regulator AlpA
MTTPMIPTDLRTLPAVVDVPTAAAILGIGRSAAYELIRVGQWPTPTLRLGKLIRIPTAPLLDLLNVSRG